MKRKPSQEIPQRPQQQTQAPKPTVRATLSQQFDRMKTSLLSKDEAQDRLKKTIARAVTAIQALPELKAKQKSTFVTKISEAQSKCLQILSDQNSWKAFFTSQGVTKGRNRALAIQTLTASMLKIIQTAQQKNTAEVDQQQKAIAAKPSPDTVPNLIETNADTFLAKVPSRYRRYLGKIDNDIVQINSNTPWLRDFFPDISKMNGEVIACTDNNNKQHKVLCDGRDFVYMSGPKSGKHFPIYRGYKFLTVREQMPANKLAQLTKFQTIHKQLAKNQRDNVDYQPGDNYFTVNSTINDLSDLFADKSKLRGEVYTVSGIAAQFNGKQFMTVGTTPRPLGRITNQDPIQLQTRQSQGSTNNNLTS